jgi:hypothetical protein
VPPLRSRSAARSNPGWPDNCSVFPPNIYFPSLLSLHPIAASGLARRILLPCRQPRSN